MPRDPFVRSFSYKHTNDARASAPAAWEPQLVGYPDHPVLERANDQYMQRVHQPLLRAHSSLIQALPAVERQRFRSTYPLNSYQHVRDNRVGKGVMKLHRREVRGRGIWDKVKKIGKKAIIPAALLAGTAYAYHKGTQGGLAPSSGARSVVETGFKNLKKLKNNQAAQIAAKAAAKAAKIAKQQMDTGADVPDLEGFVYD